MNDLNRLDQPGSDPGTASKISTKTGEWKPEWTLPVSFPEWHEILAVESFTLVASGFVLIRVHSWAKCLRLGSAFVP
jgi:hypothetical protein